MMTTTNPFHAGELEAQSRAGAGDVAAQVAGFIREYLPEQHRAFHTSLPFVVLAAADMQGRPWVTILEGKDGFITSPSTTRLNIDAETDPQDPLAAAFAAGTDVGLLGIEFATRRRNRLSGFLRRAGSAYAIDIRQTFGNCPQYIGERSWHRAETRAPIAATRSDRLSETQIARVIASDTMFIGTGHRGTGESPSNGFDASHRGGEAGFVQVIDGTHLRIPDYAGNNFFNTIGNILSNPRVGLLFVDFETGGLLHLSGRASVDWDAKNTRDPAARRMIDVCVEAVMDRPAALSLRWDDAGRAARQFSVIERVEEAENITSFYLAPADGRPLPPFKPGQHLPIDLHLPEPFGRASRSYSLSAASNGLTYRLSVKREENGVVSRAMHDTLGKGDVINAHAPSGDFVLPEGDTPVVLASAGVGQTPMLSMLQHIAREGDERPTWFVHGARNGREHAMRDEVEALVNSSRHIETRILYSKPDPQDRVGRDFHAAGRVTARSLLDLKAGPDAIYMLCGPAVFVSDIQSGLEAAGVPQGRIHFETF